MTTEAASTNDSATALSDEDAFAQGFNLNEPFTATDAPAAQATTDAPVEAAKEEPAQEDLAAKVARLELLLAQSNEAQAQTIIRLRQVEGRAGQVSGDLRAVRTRIDELSSAPAKAGAEAQPSKFEELRESYPDVAAAVDERIASVAPKAPTVPVAAHVDPVMQKAYDDVESQHPGWQTMVQTQQFNEWKSVQPLNVQLLGESDNPFDAVRLISLFKGAQQSAQATPAPTTQTAEADKAARLRAAAQPGRRAVGAETALSDEDAFAAGFNSARAT